MSSFTGAKVVHLTSAHKPFDVRIFQKECRTLAKFDYKVSLIASGEVNQSVEGVHVHCVKQSEKRFSRMTDTAWRIYLKAVSEDADLYHLHDPELIPIGFLLRLKGKKVIYDVHEDLPKSIQTKYWIPPVLRSLVARAASALEWVSSQAFSGIVAATPSIAERFPDEKTVTVQNFPILGELSQEDDLLPYNERPNHIVYMGGITERRGAIQMVEAMALLPQYLSARLVLAGSFRPSDLIHELKLLSGWQAVDFLGWMSRQELRDTLRKVRIGLVTLHPVGDYIESYPIKMFEYMAVGIPVVASNFSLWCKIMESLGCGVVVNPLKPKAIADAVQWLLEHPQEAKEMGKRGQKAVEAHYNWGVESKKLIDFYEALLQ